MSLIIIFLNLHKLDKLLDAFGKTDNLGLLLFLIIDIILKYLFLVLVSSPVYKRNLALFARSLKTVGIKLNILL